MYVKENQGIKFFAQNQQIFRQHAPPGKVEITSSAASDLKISHRLIHWLNWSLIMVSKSFKTVPIFLGGW